MTLADFLKNIADGIREKEKSAKPIAAAQYASRLKALQTVNDEFDAILMIHTSADNGNIYGMESYKSLTVVEGAIGSKAFIGYNALENVTVGNGVTAIEEQAFYNCQNLTSVTIGNGVTRIGNSAFDNCQSLVNITYIGTMAEWEAIEKGGYWNIRTGEYTIQCTDGEIGKLVVADPDASTGLDLTLNNDGISYSVTGIGTCTDTEIIIPSSYDNKFITSIGKSAFNNCKSFTSITIPGTVTSIGNQAFRYCSSLTNITIPDSVTSIGDGVFINCSALTSITIPNSVTSIGQSALYGCTSLTSVNIPEGITSISANVFYGCTSLKGVTIPNSVTLISSYAFQDCKALMNITIPNSVTIISTNAFKNCSSLTNVTIPDSVTSIGNGAFYDCTSLKSVTFKGTPETIYNNAFYSCRYLTTINVPWAEGEVANAPWGATNATVNYNYTGE